METKNKTKEQISEENDRIPCEEVQKTSSELKEIESLQELKQYWEECFIKGLPRKLTKKRLIEGYNLGISVWRKIK